MDPPGSGTLADQVKAIQKRLAEQGRAKRVAPTCQIQLAQTAIYNGEAQDFWAMGDWSVGTDTTGTMAYLGGPGVHSYIAAPVAGWYYLHYHAAVALPTGAFGSIKIVRNTPNVPTHSVATAVSNRSAFHTSLDAIRSRIYLDVNDRLYWSSYASQMPFELAESVYTVPTEITVMYLHS